MDRLALIKDFFKVKLYMLFSLSKFYFLMQKKKNNEKL